MLTLEQGFSPSALLTCGPDNYVCGGGSRDVCLMHCSLLAVPLTSTHYIPVVSPTFSAATSKNVCWNYLMSPGGQNCPWMRTIILEAAATAVVISEASGSFPFNREFWRQCCWGCLRAFPRAPSHSWAQHASLSFPWLFFQPDTPSLLTSVCCLLSPSCPRQAGLQPL